MSILKDAVKNVLLSRRKKEYDSRLKALSNSYDRFMKEQEEELKARFEGMEKSSLSRVILTMEDGMKNRKEDVVIYVSGTGILSSIAEEEICRAFEAEPEKVLLYADEDEVEATDKEWKEYIKEGIPVSRRKNPVLKPVFSRETLISVNYPGNIVAIRQNSAKEIVLREGESVYSFLLRNCMSFSKSDVIRLPLILFHKKEGEGGLRNEGNLSLKEKALKEAGFTMAFQTLEDAPGYYSEEDRNRKYPVYDLPSETGVSVIIPSKDNPDVLFRLLESLKKDPIRKQIIVVDNGSTDENKKKIEAALENDSFTYLYQPQEFNYSRMNNLGAELAKEEILLLLNDDMEMVTADAVSRMAGQLLQNGVGAVGAKLLYPDGSVIQHIGITNAVDGPVHKFIGKDDAVITTGGRNRLVHDCLGVTGACLMIKKSDYEAAGGLNEELRVAYNDVDLCFKVYESGKNCVLRPDAIFRHYESLSRGADHLSAEKLDRLSKERALLYANHPQLYHEDPYEGAATAGGAELGFDYENRFVRKDPKEKAKEITEDYSSCQGGMVIHFDRLETEPILRIDGEEFIVFQGYRLIPGIDNMRYDFYLILKGQEKSYSLPMPGFLRNGLEGGFPDTPNIALSGFCNYVTKSEIAKGTYEIAVYAHDCMNRNPVYQTSNRSITI